MSGFSGMVGPRLLSLERVYYLGMIQAYGFFSAMIEISHFLDFPFFIKSETNCRIWKVKFIYPEEYSTIDK